MNPRENYTALQELAAREGISLFGVADVAPIRDTFLIPPEVTRQLSFGIALGLRLSHSVLQTVDGGPNQLYYFHYQRANILLDQTTLKVMSWIQAQGFEAFPVPASQVMDWDKQLGTVSHREVAYRAGLGWYGRNNLLVNARYGSQVRYATVLTDLPLVADSPTKEDCGTCRACVTLCPARAITDGGAFDRDACHQQLKEFMKTRRIGQMICGVCLKACSGRDQR